MAQRAESLVPLTKDRPLGDVVVYDNRAKSPYRKERRVAGPTTHLVRLGSTISSECLESQRAEYTEAQCQQDGGGQDEHLDAIEQCVR
jgi:hypothetical protein